MFDRLSIRTKLIAIVAAPLAVILALAAMGFTQRRAEAADTRVDVDRLAAINATQSLQHELQRESLFTVTWLASDGERGRTALEEQRARTDASAEQMRAAIGALSASEVAGTTASAVLNQMGFIDTTLREQIDARSLEWSWAQELYRQLEESLPPVAIRLSSAIEAPDVASGARSLTALAGYSASTARAGILLAGAVESGGFPEPAAGVDLRQRFDDAYDAALVELEIVSAEAGAATRVRLRNQMAGGDVGFFADQSSFVRSSDADTELQIDPERWTAAVDATLAQLQEIAGEEAAAIRSVADARVADADQAARFFLAGALMAVLLALGLAIVVAASIARPVMSLTAAADRVASEQLPRLVEALKNPAEDDIEHLRPTIEHLDVGGGAELNRLTESVNAIQEMAVHVATEQATMLRKGIGDMFINLARRNQGLLDRQLEFIDELEAQEDDPDQLEHLFKLDHMATRMRRNAESLLVLAGAEPSRRRGKPVPLTKVSLAAVGEIEHFARVDLLEIDECEVTSKSAADIAHLLSELMENATQFSPPDSRVEVVGHRTGDGYTLSISDHGIGMSAEQLAEANSLLIRPPLLGLTLARTLGFIVVGRLAARHGIKVRLVASPSGGVTAIVSLPAAVLASAPSVDLTGADSPFGITSEPGAAQELFGGSLTPDPMTSAPQVSSILPPLEFGSDPIYEDEPYDEPVVEPAAGAPATLAEALPSGDAFDEGLDRVISGEAPVSPLSVRRPGAGEVDPSIPVRPAGLRPSPFDAPGPEPVSAPSPHEDPAPTVARTGPLFGSPDPAPAPSPVAPTTGPLFGGGAPAPASPAPSAAPASPAPSPAIDGRGPAPLGPEPLPAGPEPLPVAPLPTRAPAAAPPVAPAADAPAAPATVAPGGSGAPELTAAGLVKRVPRRAGATRAVPGGEPGTSRAAATTTTRSPEEVRSMLSRFHTGKQAAGQAPSGPAPTPAAPTGAPTPIPGPPALDEQDI